MEIIEGVLKNHKKGLLTLSEIPVEEEDIYLKEYNERLINKLEKKMLDLEREINQRKLAEEKLQFERNKVVNILESMADGICIVNRQYAIEYANPVLKKEFGAVEVDKCYEYLHDRKEACPWCKNQEVFTGKTVRWEWYSFKNQKTYDLIDTPLKNPDGSISKLEIFCDITDRKQAKEALRESERRLKQAVEGISIPIFIIDNNHKLTHWNKACESLTGFSASEVVGTKKQWLAFYSEERLIMADFIVDGVTEEKIASYYKVVNYNKSDLIEGAYEGEDFYPDLGEKGKWLFFTAAPLRDQQGKIVGAIQTFQDITERRSIEEQLRQSQKMEAIGTLSGGIAHDFNNILTTIIGNAELALMDVIKDESLRNGIKEIKKAGEKAAFLTHQLLAFSRKQIVQPMILDINEVLTDIEKMLGRLIGEDVELLTIQEPELWQVKIDPGQIDQVIMNLAINARDAMPKGGKLTIETDNADLDKNYFREHGIKGEKPGHYVMLAVSDTGIGMDKETREHIFEPFFTTKEVGKGTGLGLSTVYGIVKQNNGFVWVYSEPGQGSTFKVYLPKVKGDAEPKEKEQSPVDDLSGSETVLIVEDNDSLRNFAQKVLHIYGYRTLNV
ncbi:MAG: PAS domain S-box protein [Deltaproteobacteria bacterium]|nr:PAS domain S-box protein [Deltaproteobacteria bacterium]